MQAIEVVKSGGGFVSGPEGDQYVYHFEQLTPDGKGTGEFVTLGSATPIKFEDFHRLSVKI